MRKLFFVMSLFATTLVTSAQTPVQDKTVVSTEKMIEVLEDLKQQFAGALSELAVLKDKIDNAAPTPHACVDLGLSVKWATCNVGAQRPEDAGLYFAWGETTGYTSDTSDGHLFDWAHYKWMDHTINDWNGCTKYTYADGKIFGCWYSDDTYEGTMVDGKRVKNLTQLEAADDAATANWGGSWRMPTKEEQDELITKCNWTWDSTKKGYTVKGPNGNSIFLPAAGYRKDGSLYSAGSYGCYWSSSLDTSYSSTVYDLDFKSSYVDLFVSYRFCGQSVRPVCP